MDTAIFLNQKRANVYNKHTTKMASLEFLKGATRGLREEWMEGNLKFILVLFFPCGLIYVYIIFAGNANIHTSNIQSLSLIELIKYITNLLWSNCTNKKNVRHYAHKYGNFSCNHPSKY